MMLNVHKERLDSLDLKKVANEFSAVRDYRAHVFGVLVIVNVCVDQSIN